MTVMVAVDLDEYAHMLSPKPEGYRHQLDEALARQLPDLVLRHGYGWVGWMDTTRFAPLTVVTIRLDLEEPSRDVLSLRVSRAVPGMAWSQPPEYQALYTKPEAYPILIDLAEPTPFVLPLPAPWWEQPLLTDDDLTPLAREIAAYASAPIVVPHRLRLGVAGAARWAGQQALDAARRSALALAANEQASDDPPSKADQARRLGISAQLFGSWGQGSALPAGLPQDTTGQDCAASDATTSKEMPS